MAIVNHAKREINAKIVYFGHEGSGKGTSLRYVYDRIKPSLRGDMKVMPTAGSTLLFFDFSPFEHPLFDGYRIRFHIYTLQGKVANSAAWKMTLKGTDGLVLVADASAGSVSAARQSLSQLREFLNAYGVGLDDIPLVLQLNKADLAGRVEASDAASMLGLAECSACLTSAVSGDGVLEVLTTLSRSIMERLKPGGDTSKDVRAGGGSPAEEAYDTVQQVGSSSEVEIPAAVPPSVRLASEEARGPVDQPGDAALLVNVAAEGVCVEGSTVRIPLEVARPGGMQRLVVTVTVGPV